MSKKISGEFPFQSHYLKISDTAIHYIDERFGAETDTVFFFIHGNPTSCYLWRNIIPFTIPFGRTIAIDLVGFGKSGKPNIDYSYEEHYKYIELFISKLQLKNIVLVLHDWGGAIGFRYAMNNPESVKGLIFMETFCKPMKWESLNFITRWIFKKFRNSISGQKWNGKHNVFLKIIFPASINRKLTKAEKAAYHLPFQTIESRKPIVKFPQELPFEDEETVNNKLATEYFEWLKCCTLPKLLLYAKPGVQITYREVELYKREFQNLTTACIGKGKHYIQEDQPENIGEAIEQWYLTTY